jgi:hypothetical protein
MNLIRSITRYVARYGLHFAPTAHEVDVRLCEGNGHIVVITPWACLNSSPDATDDQLAAALHTSFATAEEAQRHADAECPHWHAPHNETIRDRLADARRWHGSLVGDSALEDAVDVSHDRLMRLAIGREKATAKQARTARDYHGSRV